MLLFVFNFQNEKKIVFNDTQTTESDNDPNGIIHHWIKLRKTLASPLPTFFFSIFIKQTSAYLE